MNCDVNTYINDEEICFNTVDLKINLFLRLKVITLFRKKPKYIRVQEKI